MLKSKEKNIKNMVFNDKIFTKVTYSPPTVELMFASTYDKAQGKTMKKTILCLHKNPYNDITLPKLYVAFTRVTTELDLRIWPMADCQLQRLKELNHSLEIRLLKAAYDIHGNFSKDLYMEAYTKIKEKNGVSSNAKVRKRARPTL
jgi:ATP-dependent exoDNAse (exonuclease V) alpha subunit